MGNCGDKRWIVCGSFVVLFTIFLRIVYFYYGLICRRARPFHRYVKALKILVWRLPDARGRKAKGVPADAKPELQGPMRVFGSARPDQVSALAPRCLRAVERQGRNRDRLERPWRSIRSGLRAAQVSGCHAMRRRCGRSFRYEESAQRWSSRFGLPGSQDRQAEDRQVAADEAAAWGLGCGSAIFRRLPPCARRKGGSTGFRPPGRCGASHALAGAADSGGFSGDGASRAATGSSVFVGLRFDGWRHRGRNAVHPPPAASSPGCLPVFGWSQGPLSRPRACRLGKASGRIVLRWSHQLRNADPTPFLYQPARNVTTKNSTDPANYTGSVLQIF